MLKNSEISRYSTPRTHRTYTSQFKAELVASCQMIRIDAAWLATQPLDMRAGTDTALARVVAVFGAAHPHTAYLFANKRANRMKVLERFHSELP